MTGAGADPESFPPALTAFVLEPVRAGVTPWLEEQLTDMPIATAHRIRNSRSFISELVDLAVDATL